MQNKEVDLKSFEELINKKIFTIDDSQTELSLEEEAKYSSPVDDDDDKSASAQISEKAKKLKIANEKLVIENTNLKKLSDHRLHYSWAIFVFVVLYTLSFIAIFVLVGIKFLCINDSVMKIFLGTNTIQIVGILYIVAKWLYPANGNSNGKK